MTGGGGGGKDDKGFFSKKIRVSAHRLAAHISAHLLFSRWSRPPHGEAARHKPFSSSDSRPPKAKSSSRLATAQAWCKDVP